MSHNTQHVHETRIEMDRRHKPMPVPFDVEDIDRVSAGDLDRVYVVKGGFYIGRMLLFCRKRNLFPVFKRGTGARILLSLRAQAFSRNNPHHIMQYTGRLAERQPSSSIVLHVPGQAPVRWIGVS